MFGPTTLVRAVVAAVLALPLLWSCGFHPRGSVTELSDPGSVYVDALRGTSIAQQLREALRDRAFTLASNRDDADILLQLSEEREDQRIVSVKSTGRVSEFELSHAVNLLVIQGIDGAEPVADAERPANRVRVTREYTYDERDVLGKENEARILREELREELVRQIVLRTVASLAPSVAAVSIDQPGWPFASLHHLDAVGHLGR